MKFTNIASRLEVGDANSDDEKSRVVFQCFTAVIANMPLLTYGAFAGWMSPMAKLLTSDDSPTSEPISDEELSWMASSGAITALVGVVLFSFISDSYGRKPSIIMLSVPHTITVILKLTVVNPWGLILARCIQGFSAGGCFITPSMYTKEISEDRIRGTLGYVLMLFQNIGVLCVYVIGALLDYYTILYILLPIPVLHLILSLFIPESPAYLVKQGKYEEAKKALSWLRQLNPEGKIVTQELELLKKRQEEFESMDKISFKTIWSDIAKRRAVLIGFSLLTSQTAGGCYVTLIYASIILKSTGSCTDNINTEAISLAAFLLIGVLVGGSLVERVGRRVLFMTGCSIITGCCVAVAAMSYSVSRSYVVPFWLPVLVLTISMFTYGFGVSCIPYVVMAEIFTFQLRARMLTIAMIYGWITSFVAVKLLEPITSLWGLHTMFLIYGVINLFGVLYSIYYLPETKSKSIEEIEEILKNK